LLTETILLFAIGGAAGLALARAATSALVSVLPAFPVPVTVSAPLDGRVVLFSVVISLVAAVLSGVAPALHASKTDVIHALKDGAPAASDRMRLRSALVVAQVAVSILLVITTGLLLRSFERVSGVDRGFDAENIDLATIDLSMAGYTEPAGSIAVAGLVDRIRRIPGVQAATTADQTPGAGGRLGVITVPGAVPPDGQPFFFIARTTVASDYFATLRIPLLAGRDFNERDREGAQPVAIISQSTAHEFWPGKDAIGRSFSVRLGALIPPAPPIEVVVVGIVGDVSSRSSDRRRLAVYLPFQQHYSSSLTVLVRRSGERPLADELRDAVTAINPNLPALTVGALEDTLSGPVQTQLRAATAVAGAVGIVGLLLAAIGIYGVTAHAVVRRTREIGIRVAVGADRRDVIALVLRQGMTLVGIGIVAGLMLGAAAGRVLAATRFGVPAADPEIFALAILIFSLVGLIACYVPVRRATRINAMEALRYE
jgi:predicted permease